MKSSDTIFLKLGGSLITDKTGVAEVRTEVLLRLATEIAAVWQAQPQLRLLMGHGSGSFGHVAAARHDTRHGVQTTAQWHGFTEVASAAATLNRLVVQALHAAGLPAFSVPPSASAHCQDGQITFMAVEPVRQALDAHLLPVVYGDVAFDSMRGGTIVSTEEVMGYLAAYLQPRWFLLAGDVPGVLDWQGEVVPWITPANFAGIQTALGGSRGTDVTGGMAGKVQAMLDLVQQAPGLSVRIFSGLTPGLLPAALQGQEHEGTVICHQLLPDAGPA